MLRTRSFLLLGLLLAGCQSLPSGPEGGIAADRVLLSARHCLQDPQPDQNDRVHFGPCLKVLSVDGQPAQVRPDGFIELPIRTALTLETTCIYRHADGTPIPATVQTTRFKVDENTFPEGGRRWYLHAHERAVNVVGCRPTLAPSVYPSQRSR